MSAGIGLDMQFEGDDLFQLSGVLEDVLPTDQTGRLITAWRREVNARELNITEVPSILEQSQQDLMELLPAGYNYTEELLDIIPQARCKLHFSSSYCQSCLFGKSRSVVLHEVEE